MKQIKVKSSAKWGDVFVSGWMHCETIFCVGQNGANVKGFMVSWGITWLYILYGVVLDASVSRFILLRI